jgi:hypothetical protein
VEFRVLSTAILLLCEHIELWWPDNVEISWIISTVTMLFDVGYNNNNENS